MELHTREELGRLHTGEKAWVMFWMALYWPYIWQVKLPYVNQASMLQFSCIYEIQYMWTPSCLSNDQSIWQSYIFIFHSDWQLRAVRSKWDRPLQYWLSPALPFLVRDSQVAGATNQIWIYRWKSRQHLLQGRRARVRGEHKTWNPSPASSKPDSTCGDARRTAKGYYSKNVQENWCKFLSYDKFLELN